VPRGTAIQQAMRRYAETQPATVAALSVQIGLNSGQVIARVISGRSPPAYRAMGHTTQLAADLEQLAPPGASLLTCETLRIVEGHIIAKPFNSGLPAARRAGLFISWSKSR
jgi:class 3 adenylate cyclase